MISSNLSILIYAAESRLHTSCRHVFLAHKLTIHPQISLFDTFHLFLAPFKKGVLSVKNGEIRHDEDKAITSYLTLAFVKRPHCSPYLVSFPPTSSRHSPCHHWWYPSRIPAPLREQGRSHHTAVTSHDGELSCYCSPLCDLPQQQCI